MNVVDPKNLFDEVSEGDEILWEGRSEPLTVVRHVTEDDFNGQLATMKEVSDGMAKDLRWEAEHTDHSNNDEVEGGDLLTGSLTGDEFLIVRGPRGGAYIIARWWSKEGGYWSATIVRYRRKRDGSPHSIWEWENVDLNLQIVGHDDAVDRDDWSEGLPWAVTNAEGRTIWENVLDGEEWDH